jgi:hypothetical protein
MTAGLEARCLSTTADRRPLPVRQADGVRLTGGVGAGVLIGEQWPHRDLPERIP